MALRLSMMRLSLMIPQQHGFFPAHRQASKKSTKDNHKSLLWRLTRDRNRGPAGLRWTPDGRALTYIDTKGGVSNIWSLPLDGGLPVQLTDFKADQIFWFDFSRDGKQLALSRGTQTSDVILIRDFR